MAFSEARPRLWADCRQPLLNRITSELPVILQLQRTVDVRGNNWLRLNSIAYSTIEGTRVPRQALRLRIGYRSRAVARSHPRSSERVWFEELFVVAFEELFVVGCRGASAGRPCPKLNARSPWSDTKLLEPHLQNGRELRRSGVRELRSLVPYRCSAGYQGSASVRSLVRAGPEEPCIDSGGTAYRYAAIARGD